MGCCIEKESYNKLENSGDLTTDEIKQKLTEHLNREITPIKDGDLVEIGQENPPVIGYVVGDISQPNICVKYKGSLGFVTYYPERKDCKKVDMNLSAIDPELRTFIEDVPVEKTVTPGTYVRCRGNRFLVCDYTCLKNAIPPFYIKKNNNGRILLIICEKKKDKIITREIHAGWYDLSPYTEEQKLTSN